MGLGEGGSARDTLKDCREEATYTVDPVGLLPALVPVQGNKQGTVTGLSLCNQLSWRLIIKLTRITLF